MIINDDVKVHGELKFLMDFLPSRSVDEDVFEKVGYIAGGCFKAYYTGKHIKDIDIFFLCEKDFRTCLEWYDNRGGWRCTNQTDRSVTFERNEDGMKVDLVRVLMGPPDMVISNFDFTLAKFAMDEFRVYYHSEYFKHLTQKRLVIDDAVQFPYSTLTRAIRYGSYGYGLCKESTLKLIKAIRNAPEEPNLENVNQVMYGGWD